MRRVIIQLVFFFHFASLDMHDNWVGNSNSKKKEMKQNYNRKDELNNYCNKERERKETFLKRDAPLRIAKFLFFFPRRI